MVYMYDEQYLPTNLVVFSENIMHIYSAISAIKNLELGFFIYLVFTQLLIRQSCKHLNQVFVNSLSEVHDKNTQVYKAVDR